MKYRQKVPQHLWFCLTLYACMATLPLSAQENTLPPEEAEMQRYRKVQQLLRDQVHAQAALPYTGITTNGTPVPNLFSMKSTGNSNRELVQAANDFIGKLTDEQRNRTLYPVDDAEWRQWSNMHPTLRNGVGFNEMTPEQREAAFSMMRQSLSTKGFQTSRDIMRLNEVLAHLNGKHHEYDEWFYWITIMGTPSATEPWGWQLDGHHLVINYFVLGDQVVMTPLFMGSEPASADSGVYAGTSILTNERDKGHALYASMDDDQKKQALLGEDEVPSRAGFNYARTSTEVGSDNAIIPYQGINAMQLTEDQRSLLIGIIHEYVANVREEHITAKMDEVLEHMHETWFAWHSWSVSLGKEDLFFYRIHSPVILIEFDHQGSIALPGQPRDKPIRQHVHSVVRTPNGNDYGKDLLRQHYLQHRNDPDHIHALDREE